MGETVNVLERWAIGNGGWIRVEAHPASRGPDQIVPPGHVLFVRMAFRSEDAGRLVPIEAFLYRADGKPITASAWRRVKLGRLEEYANHPENFQDLANSIDVPAPLLREAASYHSTTFGTRRGEPYRPHWVADMYWSQIPDSGVPRVTEHESAGRARWVRSVEEEPDVDATLPEPGDPEFLEAVATVYKALVAQGIAPGATIASKNNVKATTAHYWVRKAREAGFLAPGRRGRAG